MLSPQEFAAAWGEDRYRFPPGVLQDVDIPESAKHFLLEAGLPRRVELCIGGYCSYAVPLPVVQASPPAPRAKYPLLSRYESTQFRLLAYMTDESPYPYPLGHEDDVFFAIEQGTGHVYWVGYGVEGGRFVNASLAQFAEFLLGYRKFLPHYKQDEPESSRSPFSLAIRSMQQKWQQIDPTAQADPNNFWAMCFHDPHDGF